MRTTGIELARAYYEDCVALILLSRWPGLPHAAGRLGSGSDVLGLDDDTSRDHDWGLRLTLTVDGGLVVPVRELLEEQLPQSFSGWPTRFATSWSPAVQHQVEVSTAAQFGASRLGLPAGDLEQAIRSGDEIGAGTWLSLTGQAVLEVTAGEVFADTTGELARLRWLLAWYPDDVWRYVLAAGWTAIAEELPFVGRTALRGDDLGSRIVAARVARRIMHLGFMLDRRWPPYPKWFGTVFAQLPSSSAAAPALAAALAASGWREREEGLGRAIEILHEVQRSIGLPTGDQAVGPFWDRPVRGVRESVAGLLRASIRNDDVRALAPGIGAPEQWSDNVRVLRAPEHRTLPGMDQ